MNERIQELAVKAGATMEKGYIELSDGQLMFSAGVFMNKGNIDLEKFAELMLTEVISTIYRSDISDRKQELLVQELAHKFGFDQ